MALVNRCLFAFLAFGLPIFASSPSGIRNFDQVDAHVYRGGQPTEKGFRYLAQLGVKTVIDLREAGYRSNDEQRIVTEAGMTYVNVPMTRFKPPTEAEITKILRMLEDGTSGSVFVHCRRGADRTGAVIAVYHIDHDRWDNSRALKDALAHGMSVFQVRRQNYIKNFRPQTVRANTTSPAPAAASVPAPVAAPTAAVVQN
jgi:tyrosine-protein phosphatase SIW14